MKICKKERPSFIEVEEDHFVARHSYNTKGGEKK